MLGCVWKFSEKTSNDRHLIWKMMMIGFRATLFSDKPTFRWDGILEDLKMTIQQFRFDVKDVDVSFSG